LYEKFGHVSVRYYKVPTSPQKYLRSSNKMLFDEVSVIASIGVLMGLQVLVIASIGVLMGLQSTMLISL